MAKRELDNTQDILDVRDIIERVEHLRELRQPGPVDLGEDDNDQDQDVLFAELATLESLLSELKGYGGDHDWEGDWYPVTLVRDSYFVEYAQELVEECFEMPKDLPSFIEIDWKATARNIRVDYGSVEFDGVTYWYR